MERVDCIQELTIRSLGSVDLFWSLDYSLAEIVISCAQGTGQLCGLMGRYVGGLSYLVSELMWGRMVVQ